jgi:hypothetical protein
MTAERTELRAACFSVAGLIENALAEGGDLVAADHDRVRVNAGNRFCLLQGEPASSRLRAFPRFRLLIDPGARHFEPDPETLEKQAAVGGGGGEDEGAHRGANSTTRNNGLAAISF